MDAARPTKPFGMIDDSRNEQIVWMYPWILDELLEETEKTGAYSRLKEIKDEVLRLQLEHEAREAEKEGFVRVPPEKCGLYGNTFVYREVDKKFSEWRGDITSPAGRISYPIYVKKEHLHLLKVNESGVSAMLDASKAGLE